ncbi:hypothetical protein [Microbulbifer hainanensis]|uniref:hypothetical protein n=1 Tax=Microbulbifer hainanensis TaxID=2735675 RepID=UPI0018679607|nr:hypothetical protein [Microbulbifer hainanensis]
MLHNTSWQGFALFFFTLAIAWQPAVADSTNARPCDLGAGPPNDAAAAGYDERLIGICNLEGSRTALAYKSSIRDQGDVNFSVRSCSPNWTSANCDYATPYAVTLSGPKQGKQFVLTGSSGDRVKINFTYASAGLSETLKPDAESKTLFSGGDNGQQVPVSIQVALAVGSPPKDSYYSGEFTLSIDQCGKNDFGGSFPCDGSKPTTKLQSGYEIHFIVELVQDTEIRISGLQDLPLTASGSGDVQNSEDFCVYSALGAQFRLTADSQNGSGNFILRGPEDLSYSATVSDIASGSSESLSDGIPSSNTWSGHASSDCNQYLENNMRITIVVPQTELQRATGANYTDTLTLTVELQ